MRTLATSTYNRINEYNKQLNLPNWTIHHSTKQEDRFLQNKYCVTTIDQVLTGYLGFGRQSFIRGQNVLLSDVIFDEVQLFEPDKTFLTTINMLKQMELLGNRIIIMTATMPDYLINFLQKEFNMELIACEEDAVKDRNVKINYITELDFYAINKYQDKQIVICNDISQQENIASNIDDKERCIILNSRLCASDRAKIEKEVFKYFGKHSPSSNKILISTQVVEAGMDISADRVYSAISPIDNLIQRAGRNARWGGVGEFIVFYAKNYVYDDDIVEATIKELIQHNGIDFTWDVQKALVNKILNSYYEKCINAKQIKKNTINLKNNSRSQLIRDIQNINIIVCNKIEIEPEDFNREAVNVNISNLKKINGSGNDLYILTKRGIEILDCQQVQVGDTVLIKGRHCTYDKIGFRYKNNYSCDSFNLIPNISTQQTTYKDYENEEWIYHANKVRKLVAAKIHSNNIMKYNDKEIEDIAFWLGLHDLGKLDVEWQKWAGIEYNQEPLSHFPFTTKMFRHRNRKHSHISAYILKPFVNKVIFNVILQHHGREFCINDTIKISQYELHNKYKSILSKYGFNQDDLKASDELVTIKPNEVMDAGDKQWHEFLYLVGILMESDIDSLR